MNLEQSCAQAPWPMAAHASCEVAVDAGLIRVHSETSILEQLKSLTSSSSHKMGPLAKEKFVMSAEQIVLFTPSNMSCARAPAPKVERGGIPVPAQRRPAPSLVMLLVH